MPLYRRRLPHWQPEGSDIFITWRLASTLPSNLIRSASPTFDEFLDDQSQADLLPATPTWLDDPRIARLCADTLHYGQHTLHLYELIAWVVMSNHIHILITPHAELSRITKSVKNYTALQANRLLKRTGPFWARES